MTKSCYRQIFLVGSLFLLSAISAQAIDVTLAWDPNTEKDLKGYGVYVSQGVEGPPYALAGYVDIVDLDDPENPSFVVVGLTAGVEFALAVTAYDAEGNESYYSEPVCIDAGVGQIECAPLSTGSSAPGPGPSSGGGGGGGGSACFIQSAADNPGLFTPAVFALAGAVWAFLRRIPK